MCCAFFALVLIGPRAAILVWWLLQPFRFNAIFTTILWPLLGFIFLPWTTLMYVIIAPYNFEGSAFILLMGLGVLIDVIVYTGGGYGNRNRIPGMSK